MGIFRLIATIICLYAAVSYGQAIPIPFGSPVATNTQTITAVFTKTVTGTTVTTGTVNATSATQVFVGVAYRVQTGTPVTSASIVDNGSHTWTKLKQVESGTNNQSGVIIYEAHGSFGAALTVTVTCNLCAVSANGFAGTTATTVDQTNGIFNGTAGTTDASGSITTTRANNVVMGVYYNSGGAQTPTTPSGWTNAGTFPSAATFPCQIVYKINNSGTSTENYQISGITVAAGNDALIIADE